MNVGESSGRNRNLGNRRQNMTVNLTPLAFKAGSGPGGDVLGEASPDKQPWEQPPRRTDTRVGEVVKSLKNSAAEIYWNQRGRGHPVERLQSMEGDPEGTETTRSKGLERREEVSGQEGCRVESSKRQEEAGQLRQGKAEQVEKTKKDEREHLL